MDVAPKKYQNAGLRKDSTKARTQRPEEALNPFENGGLDDEDVFSVRPAFPRSRGPAPQIHSHAQPASQDLKRDYSQKNDVGTFDFIIMSSHGPLPATLSACTCPPTRRR